MSINPLEFKYARESANLSFSEAADLLETCERTIRRYEDGESKIPPANLMALKGLSQVNSKTQANSNTFTFIDLFAGIGGFHQALKELGGKCVAACEIDNLARTTYSHNHKIPSNFFFEDINSLNPADIPHHDVLCAGFPCQPFSISGKQKALNDERSNVIASLFGIINFCKPKIVILENVKHIKYVDHGKAFDLVINRLEEMGYGVTTRLLNASQFGVPQNRERWLFIGILSEKFSFRSTKNTQTPLKKFLDNSQNDNFTFLDEPFTLIDNPKKQKSGLIFCGYRNKSIRKNGVRENTTHLSRVHKQPNRIYSIHGIHPTIPSQETSGRFWILLDDGQVRKLTINECFRIMGFPDNFAKPVNLGNLYKQIGNSVCVPMIKTVMKWILEDFQLERIAHDITNTTKY